MLWRDMPDGRRLSLYVSERTQLVFAVAPILLHLDKQFEINVLAEEGFDVLTGLGAYALEHCAALAYDNALL